MILIDQIVCCVFIAIYLMKVEIFVAFAYRVVNSKRVAFSVPMARAIPVETN